MATAITSGLLAYQGAVLCTSVGTKVAIFVNVSGEVVAYGDVDSSPALLGSAQTVATIFGQTGNSVAGLSADIDSSDVIHVVATSSAANTTSYRDVAYATLSGIDGTPSWSSWTTVETYNEADSQSGPRVSVSIDSSDYPRVGWLEWYKYKGTNYRQVYYSHNVGSGWISKEKVTAQDATTFSEIGISVTPEDDVEAFYVSGTSGDCYRRRNGSWGTENVLGNSYPYGMFNMVTVDSGGTVYRYVISSNLVLEGTSSTGLSTSSSNNRAGMSLSGSTRVVVYYNSSASNYLYGSYNSGSGWATPELLESDSPDSLVVGYSHNNNNFPTDVVGVIYQTSGGGTVYYTEYDFSSAGPIYAEAHLSGSGDLDATAYKITSAAATISGAGDLAAVTLNMPYAVAHLSGSGDLGATIERIVNLSASLSGAGDLSAVGEAIVAAVAHLTGAGDLSATTLALALASATLSGTGDLSATTLGLINAVAHLSGIGDLTAAGGILLMGSATLSGTGDLSAVGERVVAGQATLSGSGNLAAVPDLLVLASATLSGGGDLSAAIERIVTLSAHLAGAGDLSAAAYLIKYAAAVLSGQGDLSATGEIGGIVEAVAHLTGAGDLSAGSYLLIQDSATLSGTGGLSASGLLIVLAAALLSGTGDLSAICDVIPGGGIVTGEAHLTGTGDLTAIGMRVVEGAASLAGAGDLSAASELLVMAAAVLSGYGDVYAAPLCIIDALAQLLGVGDLVAVGNIEGWEPEHRVYRPRARNMYVAGAPRTYVKKGD